MSITRRATTLPALITLTCFVLIAWALWTAIDVRRSMPALRGHSTAVQELIGRIDRLDEALTASVQLAASTGDPRWERRYAELETELEGALDTLRVVTRALRNSTGTARPPAEGDRAGSAAASAAADPPELEDLEHEALALVGAGDRAGAWALLEGPLYAAAKDRYAERKQALLAQVGEAVAAAERRTDARLAWVVIAAGASFVLLLVVWGVAVGARGAREQRRLQAELQRSEERLRAVVGAAPVAIIRVNRAHEVQFWNRAAERIFGWTADEVLGRPYPAGGEEQMAEAEALFTRGFAGETVEGLEIRRLRKDGTVVDLRMWSALVRDEAGVAVGMVGVLADVTEQRALERRLRQSQKLEAIGQLAGGIAHDFNNILTAVRGHAELLLELETVDGDRASDLHEIRRNAERATRLTRQLLAFSRQQVLQPRVLDLGAVVGHTEAMLRRLIGEHIQLELSVEPGLGRVEADPTQIEQVLLNLSVNARDAMPRGGRLSLRLENGEITAAEARSFPYQVSPGRYVRLVVSDTGDGMDEETRARVFEPFFTTKATGQGTGLGLATVFGIVKQSGGYVWVHSEPGVGTCFEVLLPRVEKALPEAVPGSDAGDPEAGGAETILLVEDDDAVRHLARRVLERRGYRVLEAAGPTEALLDVIPAESRPIDVLVTDVVMPDMDGHELAERVAELYPGIRTIFMSGYTEDEVVRRGIVTGTSRFLQKPFGPPDLTRTVREIIDRV